MSKPTDEMPLAFAKINNPDWHTHIMRLIPALGIKLDSAGVCHGVARTAVFAFLRGKKALRGLMDSVAATDALKVEDIPRIENAIKIIQIQLEKDLSELQEKKLNEARLLNPQLDEVAFKQGLFNDPEFIQLRKNAEQTRQQIPGYQNYLDTRAFLENVNMYHIAKKYPDLHPEATAFKGQFDTLKESASITQPDKYSDEQSIVETDRDCRPFEKDQLTERLKNLERVCKETNEPIGMLLSVRKHSITCAYDPIDKKWMLIDANQQPIYDTVDLKDTSEFIWNGLHTLLAETDSKIMMTTQLVVTQAGDTKLHHTKDITADILHELDADKITLLAPKELGRWFQLACLHGADEVVAKIIQQKLTEKIPLDTVFDAYKEALDNKHMNIIEYMMKMNVLNPLRLWIAADQKNNQTMKEVMDAGFNLDMVDSHGRSFLESVFEFKKSEIILNLLDNDLIRDEIENHADQILLLAVEHGMTLVVHSLFSQGIIKSVPKYGDTPLIMKAIEAGHDDIATILMKNGADPLEPARNYLCAIDIAIENANDDFMNDLINSAIENDNRVILKVLFDYENIAAGLSNLGPDMLKRAILHSRKEIIESLFDHQFVTVNDFFSCASSPFCTAIENDDIELAKILKKHGADVNQEDASGTTPLLLAVTSQNQEFIDLLLTSHANTDQMGKDQKTPLYMAAYANDLTTVRKLLEAGANPNFNNNKNDTTALWIAASLGYKDIVKELFKYGANPNLANAHNVTPVEAAKQHKHRDVVDIIHQFQYQTNQPPPKPRRPNVNK